MMNAAEALRYAVALSVGLGAFALVFGLPYWRSGPSGAVESFSLAATITDIKRELVVLRNTPGDTLGLALTEVEVTLLVEDAAAGAASTALTVPVFSKSALSAETSAGSSEASTVTVKLTPPRGTEVLSADAATTIRFSDLLLATRQALQDSLRNEPQLAAKSIEVVLKFVLTASDKVKGQVDTQILTAGMESSAQATRSNTVKLTFVNRALADPAKPAAP